MGPDPLEPEDGGFAYTDLVAAYDSIGKDRAWTVESAFERDPLVVWTAPEKAMKTWAAIDLCVAFVLGQSWLGEFPTRAKGPPLYLDGEVGSYEFARRAARIVRGRGGDPRSVLREIKHVSSAGLYLARECEYVVPIARAIDALRPSVVVIDPWRNHLLGDENSAKDTLEAMTVAASIRDRAKAPVIILHHLNRAGTMSGSRALRTRADLILEGTDEAQPQYSAVGRTIRTGDRIAQPFSIAIRHEDDRDDTIAKTVLRAGFAKDERGEGSLSNPARRLLEALRARVAPCSANELGKDTRIANGKVRSRAMKELQSKGLAVLDGGKWSMGTEDFFASVGPAENA